MRAKPYQRDDDYTPDLQRVRDVWIGGTMEGGDLEGSGAEFDRFIAVVRAEALKSACDSVLAKARSASEARTDEYVDGVTEAARLIGRLINEIETGHQ